MPDDTILDRVRFRSEPLADPAAVVVAGRARITVLTDRLLRLEWSATQTFEDAASYAVPFRRQPVPAFTTTQDGDVTVVDTGRLRLTWTDDGLAFHAGNLSVQGAGFRWVPGAANPGNLGGARRTVDDCRGDAVLEPGLASRSGWAVHDDSRLAVFGADGWPRARTDDEALDWYFFGHGHDYADAVQDYTRVGGAIPSVPRWALGAWWSRYHAYDDAELRQLVEDFAARDLPLSVVVIDMDWHLPDGWTGYTWNTDLFPDPSATLGWLRERGLRTTLNLHPAQGVQSFEQAYPEFARRRGLYPAGAEPIPFDITDRDFVRDYFELLHHPREAEGVDFWWMDWQQGRTTAVAGLDPLPWLNHLHWADTERPGRDRLDFSRWGGLGSHRHPVGFSGDSFAQWSALAFQPRYTAAGANVGYGWWSHDIGGHSGPDTPELYVRWVQFGAFSPVLRLHSNNQPESDRRPWAFGGRTLDLARDAFHQRYELVPYLHTAAVTATQNAQSLVRPTAWVAPDQDGAYLARSQYLLGPDLLVAPVTVPVDASTGLADTDVWLPAGEWIERTTGRTASGPRWLRLQVPLERVPQFVRPGTALPLAVGARSTDPPADLTLSVFPGGSGSARVVDDGPDGTQLWTSVTVQTDGSGELAMTIEPGLERRFVVRLEHVRTPAEVLVDGAAVTDWTYADSTLTVPLGTRGASTRIEVRADGPLGATEPFGPQSATVHAIEHRTPDEARTTLGRLVVVPADTGTTTVRGAWTLRHGGQQQRVPIESQAVTGQALVLDVPARWTGDRAPADWSAELDITDEHGDSQFRHVSPALNPAISVWRVAATDGAPPGPDDWHDWSTEPDDIDYASLAQAAVARFWSWEMSVADQGSVGWARATVHLERDRTIAVDYLSGGEVSLDVDGEPLGADVTGHPPVKFFSIDPPSRRSAAVHLPAGRHVLTFRCPLPAAGPVDWYLSAWPVDPDTGGLAFDVTAPD